MDLEDVIRLAEKELEARTTQYDAHEDPDDHYYMDVAAETLAWLKRLRS